MARLEPPRRARDDRPAGPTGFGRLRAVGWAAAHALPVIALLVFWEIFARSGAVTMFQLPPVSVVLARIRADALAGDLWINLSVTLYRALAGFVIAAAGGVALGLAMSRSRIVSWFFDPIISVGFPMPKIAFLPVVILWLGLHDVAKIAMVALDAIFPVVTATLAGIGGVARELVWSARNMGASARATLWQVVVPAALPQIMTGFQVALPIALIVAVVTEMALGGYGLGAAMMTAARLADSAGVFAGVVEIAAVGYVAVRAVAMTRRRLLLWHAEAMEPTTA